MCGRYLLDCGFDELYRKFILHEPADREIPCGEIYPSDTAPVIISYEGRHTLRFMHWGLAGYERNQLLINARSETLLQKRRFSELMDRQRCIVPATAFFEWEKQGKQKIRHTFESAGIICFAGLYESAPEGNSFTIITMKATGDVVKIHDRMPAALAGDAAGAWIDTAVRGPDAYRQLIMQQPRYSIADMEAQLTLF